MLKRVLFSILDNISLAEKVAFRSKMILGEAIFRSFPDQESYVRIKTSVKNREIFLLASLYQPDTKIMRLILFAKTAKILGAKKVHLIAPYLSYMRQDKAFHPGEAINSVIFAELISHYFDSLVTIDPHLHRHHSLSEIYTIPTQVLHAGHFIAIWIRKHIKDPVLIGPDSESKQWVSHIADDIRVPYLILEKNRKGDRKVQISVPNIQSYEKCIAVLVDDIISTAATMIETIKHLKRAGIKKIICIGVHGIFADDAYQNLLKCGVYRIVTCNTISHNSNAIDLSDLISQSFRS